MPVVSLRVLHGFASIDGRVLGDAALDVVFTLLAKRPPSGTVPTDVAANARPFTTELSRTGLARPRLGSLSTALGSLLDCFSRPYGRWSLPPSFYAGPPLLAPPRRLGRSRQVRGDRRKRPDDPQVREGGRGSRSLSGRNRRSAPATIWCENAMAKRPLGRSRTWILRADPTHRGATRWEHPMGAKEPRRSTFLRKPIRF